MSHKTGCRCFRCTGVAWNKGKRGVQVSPRKGKSYPQIAGKKHWNWKGGTSRAWARKIAKEHFSWKCSICGLTQECLDVHHKNGDKTDSNPTNLQVVCSSCHSKVDPKRTIGAKKRKGKTFEEIFGKEKAQYLKKTLRQKGFKKGKHASQKTEFRKGMIPWWKKQGFKSAKEAIIAKRGYWLKK